jgi:formylglycine-generating enzyme required for sulfatase activity
MRHLSKAFALAALCAAAQAVVPATVQDLSIQSGRGTQPLRLDWSPVSTDINGQPIAGVYYRVYRGSEPYFTPTLEQLVGVTTNEQFSELPQGSASFYRVTTSGFSMPTLTYVTVPTGTFNMGQTDVALPIHSVDMQHAIALGRTEVTNQQYLDAAQWAVDTGRAAVVNGNLTAYGQPLLLLSDPSCELAFANGAFSLRQSVNAHASYPNGYDPANHPVKMVTWYGAACYCDWLSEMVGLSPYYNGQWNDTPSVNNPYTALGYRLPTEAEWEYAARYNNGRTFPWGNSSCTCTRTVYGTCVNWSMAVGSKPSGNSSLGAQDMAGNAYEWCNDWSAAYSLNAQTNPAGPSYGTYRIIRGGGWDSVSTGCKSAVRVNNAPQGSYWSLGFRVTRVL